MENLLVEDEDHALPQQHEVEEPRGENLPPPPPPPPSPKEEEMLAPLPPPSPPPNPLGEGQAPPGSPITVQFKLQIVAYLQLQEFWVAINKLGRIKTIRNRLRRNYYMFGGHLTSFACIPLVEEGDAEAMHLLKREFGWKGLTTYPSNPAEFEHALSMEEITVDATAHRLQFLMPQNQHTKQDEEHVNSHRALVDFKLALARWLDCELERKERKERTMEIGARLSMMPYIPIVSESDVESVSILTEKFGWSGLPIYPTIPVIETLRRHREWWAAAAAAAGAVAGVGAGAGLELGLGLGWS